MGQNSFVYCRLSSLSITLPAGRLASRRTRGRSVPQGRPHGWLGGRHCTTGQYGYVFLGLHFFIKEEVFWCGCWFLSVVFPCAWSSWLPASFKQRACEFLVVSYQYCRTAAYQCWLIAWLYSRVDVHARLGRRVWQDDRHSLQGNQPTPASHPSYQVQVHGPSEG